jgi:hypothetical protein
VQHKNFYEPTCVTTVELLLRRTLVRHSLEQRHTCAAIEKSARGGFKVVFKMYKTCRRYISLCSIFADRRFSEILRKAMAVEECDATGGPISNNAGSKIFIT